MTATPSSPTVGGLTLSNRFVRAEHASGCERFPVPGRAVVVNAGVTPLHSDEVPRRPIPALSSTILVNSALERASSALVFRVADGDLSAIVHEPGWNRYADLVAADDPDFPPDTALWQGPRDSLGLVGFDPGLVLCGEASGPRQFEVTVNLWFAPAGTDCVIHTGHDFIEVHSQLSGTGRMQKFRTRNPATLYEDVVMGPGYTTPIPFCGLLSDGTFTYPWHQYRADTDCVWLAVEYHPR